MIKKIVNVAVAVHLVATAAVIILVALAFALYSVLKPNLGPAGASAAVAGVFAAVLLVAGLIMLARSRSHHEPQREEGVMDKAIAFAREKPLIAGGAALVASFIALRNPGMLATLAMGLMAPKPDKKRR
ncbi:MAG TPA: hypothetical protein VF559_13235 [Caulobacteraceae bacterium]